MAADTSSSPSDAALAVDRFCEFHVDVSGAHETLIKAMIIVDKERAAQSWEAEVEGSVDARMSCEALYHAIEALNEVKRDLFTLRFEIECAAVAFRAMESGDDV